MKNKKDNQTEKEKELNKNKGSVVRLYYLFKLF